MEINGCYKIFIKLPIRKQEATLKLGIKENQLQGSITVMGNTLEITKGKVSGDTFEFSMVVEAPIGSRNITFRGYVEGNEITGSINTPIGRSSFEGIKVD